MLGHPRLIFLLFVIITVLSGVTVWAWSPGWLWLWAVLPLLSVVGAWDLLSKHNVLRNYPIVEHLRYMLEFFRPELRQYFFESD